MPLLDIRRSRITQVVAWETHHVDRALSSSVGTTGGFGSVDARQRIFRRVASQDHTIVRGKKVWGEWALDFRYYRKKGSSSQGIKIDLFLNGEVVNPVEDRRLMHQLSIRERAVSGESSQGGLPLNFFSGFVRENSL